MRPTEHLEPNCGSYYPIMPLRCTRPKGHDGDHEAGGFGDEVYLTWPQDTDEGGQS